MHLTSAEIQQLSRLNDTQSPIADFLDGFEAVQFFLRQGDETRHDGSRLKPSTFLSSFGLASVGAVKVGSHL
ncbi:hypothetical protein ASC75_20840 [Aminobacter sp. DSM 101952]|nr:hypothetical protein ASC75_20840 [Aminobacter sp. DSM 101952]